MQALDRFGNRWQQNGPTNSFVATFTGNNPGNPQNNNRIDGYTHDAAGNIMNDGVHSYTFDAENRMTKVDGGSTATYSYDVDGHRVEKITATGNYSDPAGTWIFFYDQSGRYVIKLNSNYTFVEGQIYAGSRHLASVGGWMTFSHSDWVGTERFRTYMATVPYQTESCTSLPFGDGLNCTGSDVSNLHFTGKERDATTGLDNFGARYNSSNMGRFMSADSSDGAEPIPYAELNDPQSLNLYAYVRNNPVTFIDLDGHCEVEGKTHNFVWCGLHSLGIVQTQKERVDQARKDLSGLKNLKINGQTPQYFAKNASDKDVLAAKREVVQFMSNDALAHLICPQGTDCRVVVPLGLGSTGRVVATTLEEQLAMEEVMAAPKGTPIPIVMNDPRWPASDGWVKMTQTVNGVEIHWVENTITGAVDDFKFK